MGEEEENQQEDTVVEDGVELDKEALLARLAEENDDDAELDLETVLDKVKGVDQSILGQRLGLGLLREGEEEVEEDALRLQ